MALQIYTLSVPETSVARRRVSSGAWRAFAVRARLQFHARATSPPLGVRRQHYFCAQVAAAYYGLLPWSRRGLLLVCSLDATKRGLRTAAGRLAGDLLPIYSPRR